MTTPVDSFGTKVRVGDYVYFRTKTKYATAALSLGRVTKISPSSGSMSLKAINTRGATLAQYRINMDRRGSPYTFNQVLASASSTVVLPTFAVPIDVAQILEE